MYQRKKMLINEIKRSTALCAVSSYSFLSLTLWMLLFFAGDFFLPVIRFSFHICCSFLWISAISITCWQNRFVSQFILSIMYTMEWVWWTAGGKFSRQEDTMHESVNTDQMVGNVPITSVIVKSILINYHTIFFTNSC